MLVIPSRADLRLHPLETDRLLLTPIDPSDGPERVVASTLMIVSTAPGTAPALKLGPTISPIAALSLGLPPSVI